MFNNHLFVWPFTLLANHTIASGEKERKGERKEKKGKVRKEKSSKRKKRKNK